MITPIRTLSVVGIGLVSVAYSAATHVVARAAAPLVNANPNTEPAGVLRDGVLSVTLEARTSAWRFSDRRSPMMVDALDSIVVAPGGVATLTTHATAAGNYLYRATVPDGPDNVNRIGGVLGGGIVVDTARAPARPRDRVFVIMATEDSVPLICDDTVKGNPAALCPGRRFLYTINGLSWPNTERLHAAVGDSLHWRVINASNQEHPMHLHSFSFRVDDFSDPHRVDAAERPVPGQQVVTQVLPGFSTMSVTWSPDRPGNWLFHCHLAVHNSRYELIERRGVVRRRAAESIVHPRPDSQNATHYALVLASLSLGVTARPHRAQSSSGGAVARRLDLHHYHHRLQQCGPRPDEGALPDGGNRLSHG